MVSAEIDHRVDVDAGAKKALDVAEPDHHWNCEEDLGESFEVSISGRLIAGTYRATVYFHGSISCILSILRIAPR